MNVSQSKSEKIIADKIISSNRKTIAIEIKQNAEVWIRKPHSVSNKKAVGFLEEKKVWISKRLEEQKTRKAMKFDFHKNQIFYEGEKYQVLIKANIDEASVSGKILTLPETDSNFYKLNFLFTKSHQKLLPMAWELASKYKFEPANIKISKARKSWGTCSGKASINLSWRLIQMPAFCQEYVMCHEMAHLIEMNHSERFWGIVEKMLPDYKLAILWIKNNKSLLL